MLRAVVEINDKTNDSKHIFQMGQQRSSGNITLSKGHS